MLGNAEKPPFCCMSLAMISMRYFKLRYYKYLYNGQIPSLRRPFIGDIVVDYILIFSNLYLKYCG